MMPIEKTTIGPVRFKRRDTGQIIHAMRVVHQPTPGPASASPGRESGLSPSPRFPRRPPQSNDRQIEETTRCQISPL
jgi:hypothetical protein